MKKFILVLLMFSFVGCVNPSMEKGLEGLDKALAELAAAIDSLNIPQMQDDLEQMNIDVAQIEYDLLDAEGGWSQIIEQLNQLHLQLQGIVEVSETWATSEDMANLLADVQSLGEGIDILVLRADYDYDGVINAIDKCPDTPIMEINNVNAQGCAAGETPVTTGD